jgi:hypothetical protein
LELGEERLVETFELGCAEPDPIADLELATMQHTSAGCARVFVTVLQARS